MNPLSNERNAPPTLAGGTATEQGQPLGESGPRAGQVLALLNREWTVTEYSTYLGDDGLHVDEWECQSSGETGYLLEETDRQARVQWFFTRSVPSASVGVDRGQTLGRWLAGAASARPPERLTYRGQSYVFAETSEGSYAEDSEQSVRKSTWEYWDARHAYNLAVERWPDGHVACYFGAYVDRASIRVKRGTGATNRRAAVLTTLLTVLVLFPVAATLAGAVDRVLAGLLVGAVVIAFVVLIVRFPVLAMPGALAAAALGLVFSRFPPLTTPAGAAMLLIAPAAVARWTSAQGSMPSRAAVHTIAFVAVALPIVVVGCYRYFWFAPAPHGFGQFALAVGPALVGGAVAALVSALVLRISD